MLLDLMTDKSSLYENERLKKLSKVTDLSNSAELSFDRKMRPK